MTANNCTNPPHFPPHCGCPAGYAPSVLCASVPAPFPRVDLPTMQLTHVNVQGAVLPRPLWDAFSKQVAK